jgi:hypothetical protein
VHGALRAPCTPNFALIFRLQPEQSPGIKKGRAVCARLLPLP